MFFCIQAVRHKEKVFKIRLLKYRTVMGVQDEAISCSSNKSFCEDLKKLPKKLSVPANDSSRLVEMTLTFGLLL